MPGAAPRAEEPACAQVLDAAPAGVLGEPAIRGGSPTPGVLTWGDPPIVLRCGLEPSGPTTVPCVDVDGVDWLVDDAADPVIFTTYGREPGVEVRVPLAYGRENATGALVDLGPAVATLTGTRRCVG